VAGALPAAVVEGGFDKEVAGVVLSELLLTTEMMTMSTTSPALQVGIAPKA